MVDCMVQNEPIRRIIDLRFYLHFDWIVDYKRFLDRSKNSQILNTPHIIAGYITHSE